MQHEYLPTFELSPFHRRYYKSTSSAYVIFGLKSEVLQTEFPDKDSENLWELQPDFICNYEYHNSGLPHRTGPLQAYLSEMKKLLDKVRNESDLECFLLPNHNDELNEESSAASPNEDCEEAVSPEVYMYKYKNLNFRKRVRARG